MRPFLRQDGFSFLSVFTVLAVVGFLAFQVVSRVKQPEASKETSLHYDQAYFMLQAGVEYAMRRLYEGKSPLTGDFPFGAGTFRVVRSGPEFTVAAYASGANVIRNITPPAQGDCLRVDTVQSRTQGKGAEIGQIWLSKRCNESITIDRMILSWSPDKGEVFDQVGLGLETPQWVYTGPPSIRSGGTVELIDYPLADLNRHRLDGIRFPSTVDMREKEFRLVFVMKDGSRKEVPFTLAPCLEEGC